MTGVQTCALPICLSIIGKKTFTIVQVNGSTLDLILNDCMYFPDVYLSCFIITKALGDGMTTCNHSIHMVLSKFDGHILLHQVFKTTHGYVCISEILTSYDTESTAMDLAARDQCPSPYGGEPPSNYLPDKCQTTDGHIEIDGINIGLTVSEIYLNRSMLKLLVTAKYGEPMEDHKEIEWYNV